MNRLIVENQVNVFVNCNSISKCQVNGITYNGKTREDVIDFINQQKYSFTKRGYKVRIYCRNKEKNNFIILAKNK